jgi:membrane protease YdiL (CAAX protease family)
VSTPGWGTPGDDEEPTATVGPPQRPSPWDLPPPSTPGSAAEPAQQQPPPTGWPAQPVAPYQPQPWPGQSWPAQPSDPRPSDPRPYDPQQPRPPWAPDPWGGAWTPQPRLGPPQAWQPRPYPQLLRGPNHRWWRPLASLGIVIGLTAVAFALFLVTVLVIDRFDDSVDLSGDGIVAWGNTAPGMLVTNLLLAAFIPITMVAVWWGHGWRPRWLGSVAGGIRWRWLGLALGISIAFMGVTQVGLSLFDDPLVWKPAPDFWWLVAVVLLTTPLQAAGEEYLARGWLTQATGSLIPGRIAAGLAGALVSGVVFAWLHGDQSFWLYADRFVFGLVASALAWWTGGLESGIALHTANNYVVLVLVAAIGDLSSLNETQATMWPVLLDVGLLVVLGALLAWLGRRRRLQRLFRPPARPGAVTSR